MTLPNSKNGLLVKALKDQISAQAIQGLGKGHLDLATMGQMTNDHKQSALDMVEKLGEDERNKLRAQAGTVAAGFLLPQTVSEAMKQTVSEAMKLNATNGMAGTAAIAAAKRMTSAYDFLDGRTKSLLTGGLADLTMAKEVMPRLAPIRPLHFTPPEDTKLGRATLATAEQLQEVVRLNFDMVTQVTNLTQLFIGDVFPKWQQKLKDDQAAADEARKLAEADAIKRQSNAQSSLDQANQNLKVAKWALIASVAVSLAMTSWQLWVAKSYREQDAVAQAEQQLKADALAIKQQEVLETLSKQLGEAAAARAPKADIATSPKAVGSK